MTVPDKLFRNTKLLHAKAFVEEGEIMFRPLSYFRRLEDPERGDAFEGKYSRNLAGAKISVDVNDDGNYVPLMDLMHGEIMFNTEHDDRIHVACFSKSRQVQLGPATIEIFRPKEFLAAVKEAFKDVGADLNHGVVKYYDPALRFSGIPSDEIWLQKRILFQHQDEFRLGFFVEDRKKMYRRIFGNETSASNSAEHIKIRLGCLTAYAKVIEL